MLDRLSPRPGSRRKIKRIGRGLGSGNGKTSGRGVKGQGKRSAGRETPFHFEGGQMPIVRRLPKRGFHSLFGTTWRIVNVGSLAPYGDGGEVDPTNLEKRGIVEHGKSGVKLLAEGEPPKNLRVKVHQISASARKKIEDAGGSVELIG
jgi:large subunit ribosomal protein L15